MTTENNTVAKISHAYKAFDKREVLQDVNLQIESGKILGLIGPSGAGKSTTIKCLLGMEKLDKGETTIFETKMPNRKILGHVGYMGQSDALYNELTAKENLIFFGQLMGMEKDKLKQAIDKKYFLSQFNGFSKPNCQNIFRWNETTTILSDYTLVQSRFNRFG